MQTVNVKAWAALALEPSYPGLCWTSVQILASMQMAMWHAAAQVSVNGCGALCGVQASAYASTSLRSVEMLMAKHVP